MTNIRKFRIIINSKELCTCSGSSPSSVAKKAVKKLCEGSKKTVKFSLKECKCGCKKVCDCKKVCGPYQGHMEKLDKPYKRNGKLITQRAVCEKVQKMKGGDIGNCGANLVMTDFWLGAYPPLTQNFSNVSKIKILKNNSFIGSNKEYTFFGEPYPYGQLDSNGNVNYYLPYVLYYCSSNHNYEVSSCIYDYKSSRPSGGLLPVKKIEITYIDITSLEILLFHLSLNQSKYSIEFYSLLFSIYTKKLKNRILKEKHKSNLNKRRRFETMQELYPELREQVQKLQQDLQESQLQLRQTQLQERRQQERRQLALQYQPQLYQPQLEQKYKQQQNLEELHKQQQQNLEELHKQQLQQLEEQYKQQ
jgi:hypothetical protein